ncbi:MAG TPA: hypothetical protein VGT41_06650 [Candidatus Babeliales bacterium]|nr:hypothetical protein [Candidatus Babeliales bacterium]
MLRNIIIFLTGTFYIVPSMAMQSQLDVQKRSVQEPLICSLLNMKYVINFVHGLKKEGLQVSKRSDTSKITYQVCSQSRSEESHFFLEGQLRGQYMRIYRSYYPTNRLDKAYTDLYAQKRFGFLRQAYVYQQSLNQ